ncbi:MAG: A/G-specific adenine glycosylase [Sporichthyaceae bacterium]
MHPPAEPVVDAVLAWYDVHARDLPWRAPEAGPWAVLVSEFMLQQTPVARVLPVWERWTTRWPAPADLAAATPGDAVLAWDRLGYPRRALRLHGAATAIVERHGGRVPAAHGDLLALPGVGEYTAAAVAAFAFGQRHVVLDTNVRRVLARVLEGRGAVPAGTTAAERRLAAAVLPAEAARSARWNVAAMELGALVCTAARPGCERCPVADRCAWLAAGRPASDLPKRTQAWAGTDRMVRGRLMAALRGAAPEPVAAAVLDACWEEPVQRARALDSLVVDGLVDPLPDGRFALPSRPPTPSNGDRRGPAPPGSPAR